MDVVQFKDWREVAGLPESVQRSLLVTGDPAERIWAIWALGLRLGKGVLADLQKEADLEALPGVRCQLVVVLAGLGERDLLRASALEDPDPVVRATACQYVVRTMPVGSDLAVDFAIQRMRADVPRVQHAMYEEIQAGRLRLPDPVLLEFLAHDDLETRQLTLEVLAAILQPSDEIVRALADRVLSEPDPFLRRSCIDFYLRCGVAEQLVRAAYRAPAPLVCEILAIFQQRGLPFSWTVLAPLAGRADQVLAVAVLKSLIEPLETEAIPWVSDLAAAALAIPHVPATAKSPLLTFRWEALARLFRVVAPETVRLFDRSVAQALLDWSSYEDEYDDDVGGRTEDGTDRAKRELLAKHVGSFRT
jgi:hypothetical protein